MTDSRQLALEYLKMAKIYGPQMAYGNTTIDEAIAALEADLAAKVEPFGYWHSVSDPDECEFHLASDISGDCDCCIPLFTLLQQAVPAGFVLIDVEQLREIIIDIGQHIQQGRMSESANFKQTPSQGTGIYTHIWHKMRDIGAMLTTAPRPAP